MRTKYFITPFGVSGTITPAVPDATDPDGFVSYNQGWTFDYQRDLTTDPLAKSPTYVNLNSIWNDVTTSLQALQQGGVAEFITASNNGGSAFSYGLGAVVLYSASGSPPFNLYLSLVSANTTLPSVTANWKNLSTFFSFPYGPLNQANTWTAAQTFNSPIIMANNIAIQGKDASGTARAMLFYTSDNYVRVAGGQVGFSVVNFAETANNLIIDDAGNAIIRLTLTTPEVISPVGGVLTGSLPNPGMTAGAAVANIGFTPVQQGGGTGQGTNKIFIGWDGSAGPGAPRLEVDASDLGSFAMRSWVQSIFSICGFSTNSGGGTISTGASFTPLCNGIIFLNGNCAQSNGQFSVPIVISVSGLTSVGSLGNFSAGAVGNVGVFTGQFTATKGVAAAITVFMAGTGDGGSNISFVYSFFPTP